MYYGSHLIQSVDQPKSDCVLHSQWYKCLHIIINMSNCLYFDRPLPAVYDLDLICLYSHLELKSSMAHECFNASNPEYMLSAPKMSSASKLSYAEWIKCINYLFAEITTQASNKGFWSAFKLHGLIWIQTVCKDCSLVYVALSPLTLHLFSSPLLSLSLSLSISKYSWFEIQFIRTNFPNQINVKI